MSIELALLLSVISVSCSVYFGFKNNKKTDEKEVAERVKQDTRINMKLDAIAGTTNEVKGEISSMREELKTHNDKIIRVEEKASSAHKRIDGLEKRLNSMERGVDIEQ